MITPKNFNICVEFTDYLGYDVMKYDWVSVIIPTLNEALYIDRTIMSLLEDGFDGEIIIADGGSTDQTQLLAMRYKKVKVISCQQRGRGAQMNEGAQVVTTPFLLFIHGDSIFPQRGMEILERYIQGQRMVAGCFSLAFDNDSWQYRFLSKFSRLNLTWTTYGDQGLLIQREIFEELEGFKEIPLMEDVDLLRRIKQKYVFHKLPLAMTTSARRFEKKGPICQTLLNVVLVIAYYAGVSPERLARYYTYTSNWQILKLDLTTGTQRRRRVRRE